MFFTEVFLNHLKEARYSYKTIKDYSYLLQKFENYFKIREVSKIQNVSQEIIYGFFEMIKTRKCSDREYYTKLIMMRKYFNYLEENGFIFISPLKDFSIPKYQKTSFPVLEEKEIRNILEKIKTDHPLCIKGKAIIELAISYMLNHWEPLTLFLRVPKVPLVYNLC